MALKTFYCEETKSGYVEGFKYTVREGNDLLKKLARKWAEEGVVEFIHDNEASLGGSGEVRWQ